MKYKSYSITLRPKSGIIDDDITMVKKITLKYCKFYHIITEKEDDERHIHGAMYLQKSMTSSAFNQMFKRLLCTSFEKRDSVWRYAYSAHNMYNDDFVTKYLNKGDSTVTIMNKLPDLLERNEYYADTVVPVRSLSRSADPYFKKLYDLYFESIPRVGTLAPSRNPTLQELEHFMCTLMFDQPDGLSKIRIIRDERKMRQICQCLKALISRCPCYPWQRGNVESEIDGYC